MHLMIPVRKSIMMQEKRGERVEEEVSNAQRAKVKLDFLRWRFYSRALHAPFACLLSSIARKVFLGAWKRGRKCRRDNRAGFLSADSETVKWRRKLGQPRRRRRPRRRSFRGGSERRTCIPTCYSRVMGKFLNEPIYQKTGPRIGHESWLKVIPRVSGTRRR